MADNLTKQLIETVKNKVPLTGGLSIKGYPVMGTLSDMKNFKIEEGVLKLRYGTKTVASFDNKRFYFLKNFEFCGAEVLFGLDYQLCLHAFFENYEGYDFIVRDASQFHKNEMIFRQGNATLSGNYRGNNYWEAGLLFGGGSQFWAYENQKYIMFFNDLGDIKVIVKDGGFKVHKDEQYIEVDIKDATNRVFDVPPALKDDTRNVAPRITGEYRFARVNELGVISELTEPQYLQQQEYKFVFYGSDCSKTSNNSLDILYDNIKTGYSYKNYSSGETIKSNVDVQYEYDSIGHGFIICSNKPIRLKTVKPVATFHNEGDNIRDTYVSYESESYDETEIPAGCYFFTDLAADLGWNYFYLDLNEEVDGINDIYDISLTSKRFIFYRLPDNDLTPFSIPFYDFNSGNTGGYSFAENFFYNESGLMPAQMFKGGDDDRYKTHVVALQTRLGDATPYIIHASDVQGLVGDMRAPDTWVNNKANWKFYQLQAQDKLLAQSKGELFTFNWWFTDYIGDDPAEPYLVEKQFVVEGKIYPVEFKYKTVSGSPNVAILQNYCYKIDKATNAGNAYEMTPVDTIVYKENFEAGFNGNDAIILSSLQDKGRFAIWNDSKILGISQRLFVNKNTPNVPVYIDNNADPNDLLVRYSPVLSLEFMNQRSFRFELPLIRRAIRKPQFLCVSNNYVYEFEDNRLWYGSAYDFMLTGYTYLDGSLLKLIAYNEGVLACTTSGLYYVNRETVQPVANGRAIRADFAGETQVGGVVIAENKVYIVRTEITDSGARIETANLISEPINELVFNGTIKLTCNKRQLYLADDYNVYGFDTRAGIWNLRYNYGNKRIANIFILDNRLGILFDNEIDVAKANEEIKEILPR